MPIFVWDSNQQSPFLYSAFESIFHSIFPSSFTKSIHSLEETSKAFNPVLRLYLHLYSVCQKRRKKKQLRPIIAKKLLKTISSFFAYSFKNAIITTRGSKTFEIDEKDLSTFCCYVIWVGGSAGLFFSIL